MKNIFTAILTLLCLCNLILNLMLLKKDTGLEEIKRIEYKVDEMYQQMNPSIQGTPTIKN